MGSATAVWTSATMSAELAMEVISHAAPTDWIRLPKFDARLAIHTLRKMGSGTGKGTRVHPYELQSSKMQGLPSNSKTWPSSSLPGNGGLLLRT